MNILECVNDPNLFKPFLGDYLTSWRHWLTALKCLYGLPVHESEHELIRQCTGRDPGALPQEGFQSALFLVGRRSGKSRIAALAAAFEAALSNREQLLSRGELGMVAVVSPTRSQSRIVRSYIRGCFDATPILRAEVTSEDRESFTLKNGVEINVLTGDYRHVRGFSLLSTVVDEICYFGLSEEGKIRSDTELVNALKPGLATTAGRMICIGSPYSQKGWAHKTWKRCYGNDKAATLVWNAPSRTMNPTLPQSVVDQALEEDLQAAKEIGRAHV